MRKYFFSFLFLLLFVPCVSLSQGLEARNQSQLNAFAGEQGANYGRAQDPRLVAAGIIKIGLTLLGVMFLSYTVYAGYLIMTAAGNDEQITKGKSTLRTAIIGILVILASYGITRFVTEALQEGIREPGFEFEVNIEETLPNNPDPLSNENPYLRLTP